ncbi:hypothetical protein GOP47_0029602 [Adiantum capillus-veneris]|nr:hypothetical protein GOP47_0029602 [Adiantum capillus-veneris]
MASSLCTFSRTFPSIIVSQLYLSTNFRGLPNLEEPFTTSTCHLPIRFLFQNQIPLSHVLTFSKIPSPTKTPRETIRNNGASKMKPQSSRTLSSRTCPLYNTDTIREEQQTAHKPYFYGIDTSRSISPTRLENSLTSTNLLYM